MARGSGKTSLVECACIWAVLYGHRDFGCLIGSDESHAMDMLDSIKMELDANELLAADFPEVIYPISVSMALPIAVVVSSIGDSERTSAGRPKRSCCRRSRLLKLAGTIVPAI